MNNVFRDIDWYLVAPWLVLSLVGFLAVFSATYPDAGGFSALSKSHLLYFGMGIVAAFIAYRQPSSRMYDLAYILWLSVLLLLAGVELFGKLGMGAVRWIEIAGVRFQPSELMKIGVIVALARWLGDRAGLTSSPATLVGVAVITIFPVLLVAAQPDLATSTIFLAPAVAMLFWAGFPVAGILGLALPVVAMFVSFKLWLLILTIVAGLIAMRLSGASIRTLIVSGIASVASGLLAPWLWLNKLHEYQRNRVLTFLNPDFDPLGKGYQSIQSKIAVGSGGITGKGFLAGTQTQLDFLPIQHTDFIFSVWAEEWGFLGAFLILLSLTMLFWRLWGQAYRAKNRNNGLILAGITGLWVYQSFINIGMTVGILPVAGIPLPFLSYGGSSMLTHCWLMGMALGISTRWRSYG